MKYLVPWVMYLLFGLIAQIDGTHEWKPCGVVNGTPHGFFLRYDYFLVFVS